MSDNRRVDHAKLFKNDLRRKFLNFLRAQPWAADLIRNTPFLHRIYSKKLIAGGVTNTAARPQPYTLWTPTPIDPAPAGVKPSEPPVDYISWTGLVDRRFTGRHLPPAPASYTDRLPDVDRVLALYKRREFIASSNCSALLCFFAQWFTDSFLRKDYSDERLNTSNQEIDLCEIYGLDAKTTRLLRTVQGGKLKTREGGRFPERLYDEHGHVKTEFAQLSYVQAAPGGQSLEDRALGTLEDENLRKQRKLALYATGLDRGNSTIFYTAISSIFIREHNRLCDLLARAHSDWDDDRLFETARNINIVTGLNLTINEYINQLSNPPVKLFLDRSFAEDEPWYRQNRIAIEFDLLYRWHSFVPDVVEVNGHILNHLDYRFNNELLEEYGAAALIAAASRQPGGQIGLYNNPHFLEGAERAAHTFARNQRLRPFVEYQAAFAQRPVGDFKELAGDTDLARQLYDLYNGEIRDVEFLVGLFAQQRDLPSVILPLLLRTMVAVDAFSQILTNPLLSRNVYGPDALSKEGMEVIENTQSFDDLVKRNLLGEDYPNPASFAYDPKAAASMH
jgi:prostaglandin-endoperoxide synthase 2